MDTKEMQGRSECGDCGECKHSMCGHGHWKHILIKVLVALFIFWAGMQVGELKGLLRGYGYGEGYGYGMMGAYRDSAGQNQVYGTPGGMMGGWFRAEVSTTTAR